MTGILASVFRAGLFALLAWIQPLYADSNAALLWFTPEGERPAIAVALLALHNAAERGLVADDYDVASLDRQLSAIRRGQREDQSLASADGMITRAILRFLSDLRFGRIEPQQIAPHYRASLEHASFAEDLRKAVAEDRLRALIDAAEPSLPQYQRLKRALASYRKLAAEPAIALPVPASSRTRIVAGDRYAGAQALHAQLVRLGDLPSDSPLPAGDTYTTTLSAAVRRFQSRHGLETDGVLGDATLAALNMPLAARVTQIRLSLERLRWLPRLPHGPLVAINIPSFQLWALADAAADEPVALSTPVVVGRAMRTETPVFIGEMRFVEFSPYWNVPQSILHNELLPRLARDSGHLAREHMEVVSTSGDRRTLYADDTAIMALRSGQARLRQRPGPDNALGGVKFGLPNAMDIYLHATPARELFERSRRDFSHGCIRVRDAEALARFVLRNQTEWTPQAIALAMNSGINRTVPVTTPIPVLIFYTTAFVERDDDVLFLPDVYGHDRKLMKALQQRSRATRGASG